MIIQKRRPSLCRLRVSRSLSHPAQHRSLRDIEAQHLQLTMNTRRAPSRILRNHAKDEVTEFSVDALSAGARAMARQPRPIQLESCAMPPYDRLRLHDDQRTFPPCPEPLQDHPEQFVGSGKSRLGMPLFQYGELLSQGHILQKQVTPRTEGLSNQNERESKQAQHETSFTRKQRLTRHRPWLWHHAFRVLDSRCIKPRIEKKPNRRDSNWGV